MIPPAYQGLEAGAVTLLASADAGSLVRVIAGDVGGRAGFPDGVPLPRDR